MTSTLKPTTPGSTSWLSRLLKAKNTSEAGLTDSTGNGRSKDNAPEWTTIIIFIVFGIAMWLVPGPFDRSIKSVQGIPVPMFPSTHVDTLNVPYPVYTGRTSTSVVQVLKMPTMVEIITDKDEPNAHIYIRTTSYPIVQGDSLRINMVQEYNIQPKGMEIIRVDSIPYPVPVPTPVEVPFFEKPAVVATGTVAIVLGIVYIVGQALK